MLACDCIISKLTVAFIYYSALLVALVFFFVPNFGKDIPKEKKIKSISDTSYVNLCLSR